MECPLPSLQPASDAISPAAVHTPTRLLLCRFAALERLLYLSLSNNALERDDISTLCDMSTLTYLDLSLNAIGTPSPQSPHPLPVVSLLLLLLLFCVCVRCVRSPMSLLPVLFTVPPCLSCARCGSLCRPLGTGLPGGVTPRACVASYWVRCFEHRSLLAMVCR